jgi:hypothetical protein
MDASHMNTQCHKKSNRGVLFVILCVLCALSASLAALNAFAMDPEGCFTCHQYPGLVTFRPPDNLEILHIDESLYLKSAHGRFECRKCHVSIETIPHPEESRIDCTSQCHLEEKDKRRIAAYPLEGFHAEEQSAIVALKDGSSCRACHPLYPHSQNVKVRAFLNLHTGFMVCEVCHLNREKYADIVYDWSGAEVADYKGRPFGTFYNPKLKQVEKSEHFISRISVFQIADGTKKHLLNTWDTPEAVAYMQIEKRLTSAEKKRRLAFFHRDIDRKEISVACDECHSDHSILDFERLGFSKAMTNNLINLNIKGLVTKYEVFYFPHLFDQ